MVGANRFGRRLNEVDIFRVAVGAAEEDLVERRAASEGKSGAEKVVREDGDERAADQQVLFDLLLLGPRRLRRPFQDVGLRDQDRSPGVCGFSVSIGGRFVRFLARPGAGRNRPA
jgi:hypothetical protein